MDRTRLIVTSVISLFIFGTIFLITSQILPALIALILVAGVLEGIGVMSDRATKKRAIERQAQRTEMLAKTSEAE